MYRERFNQDKWALASPWVKAYTYAKYKVIKSIHQWQCGLHNPRRWASIKPTLVQRLVLPGTAPGRKITI